MDESGQRARARVVSGLGYGLDEARHRGRQGDESSSPPPSAASPSSAPRSSRSGSSRHEPRFALHAVRDDPRGGRSVALGAVTPAFAQPADAAPEAKRTHRAAEAGRSSSRQSSSVRSRRRAGATVVLQISITATGAVADVEDQDRPGPAFDASALRGGPAVRLRAGRQRTANRSLSRSSINTSSSSPRKCQEDDHRLPGHGPRPRDQAAARQRSRGARHRATGDDRREREVFDSRRPAGRTRRDPVGRAPRPRWARPRPSR